LPIKNAHTLFFFFFSLFLSPFFPVLVLVDVHSFTTPRVFLSRVQVHLFHLTMMKEKRSSATNSYKSWLSFKSHQTDASGHKSPEHANATVSPVKSMVFSTSSRFLDDDEYERPTVEEESILRRVSGKVPWVAYTIAFVELCERFSFFGTAAVCESSSPRVIQFWILT